MLSLTKSAIRSQWWETQWGSKLIAVIDWIILTVSKVRS